MPTDYNQIAERYQETKGQPWRTHVGVNPSPETHTYRKKPAAKSCSNSLGGRYPSDEWRRFSL